MAIKLAPDRQVPLGDRLTQKIVARAESATPEELKQIDEIMQRAMACRDNKEQDKLLITAGMAAQIFLNHNQHNRDWDAAWSVDIGNIMTSGNWRLTQQGYSFYAENGKLGDGQHRMAAQALTNSDFWMFILFGITDEDVAAMDCGKRRNAWEVAERSGVVNAKLKGEMFSAVLSYERAVHIPVTVNEANFQEVANQIRRYDEILARAIEIGELSVQDAPEPLLAEKTAARIAAITLRHNWPDARLIARLEEIQSSDFESEKAPLLATRRLIEEKRPAQETIRPQREVGVVIKGMQLAESGVLINPRRIAEIKNAIKNPPDPTYPSGRFISTAAE